MEALIDKTYFFKGHTFIAGLNKKDAENEEKLIGFINQYQQEFLNRAFGSKLTEAQINEIRPLLVNDIKKVSPLANYIYCIYLEDEAEQNTDSGVVQMNIQNTTQADWRKKIVKAWNEMVVMLQDIHNELYQSKTLQTINYLNDIQFNVAAKYTYLARFNQTNGVYLEGGIFSKKDVYDYKR